MMKFLPAVIIVLFCSWHTLHAQKVDTVNSAKYFVIDNDPTVMWIYKTADTLAFLDLFARETKKINGVDYAVRIRKYSTGAYDTAYYRSGPDGYYRTFVVPSTGRVIESLAFPSKVFVGKRWYEVDSTWGYQVVATNDSLTTPTGTYHKLIVVTSVPIRTKDPNAKQSKLYFAEGIGLVACTIQDAFVVYLKGMRKVTGKGAVQE